MNENTKGNFVKMLLRVGGEHVFFVFATILTSGVHFLFSVYIKKYIMPLEYGIYSSCVLVQTYLAYIQLGTLNSFNRDYPQLIGANNIEEAKKYRNVVFSYLIFVGLCVIAIASIVLVGYEKKRNVDIRYSLGVFLCTIISVFTLIENFGNYRARIDKGFRFVGVVMLLELLPVLMGLYLIPRYGYYAIYVYNIFTALIGIIFFFRVSYSDIKVCIDFSALKDIIIAGAPLLINGLIWTILNSIDKFLILGHMNTEQLGMYGIAQNAFSYMVLIPSALSQMFYAKMGREYGERKSVKHLSKTALGYSRSLVMVTSMMVLLAFFGIPILVRAIMPAYVDGVESAQILIVGLAVYASTMINGNILTILKKNSILLRNSICMCFFNLIFSSLMIKLNGASIESVAYGTSISYVVNSFLIVKSVSKATNTNMFALLRASSVPVCISILPGIIVYYIIENKIIGFIIAVMIVIMICSLIYKDFLKKILFGSKF